MNNIIDAYKCKNELQTEYRNNNEIYFGKPKAPEWCEWLVPNVYYISDIHLEHHLKGKTQKAKFKDIKRVVDNIFSDYSDISQKNLFDETRAIIFLGDICERIETARIFYTYFTERWIKYNSRNTPLIVVLGNHELAEFRSYKDCYAAYERLFDELRDNNWGDYHLLKSNGYDFSRRKRILDAFDITSDEARESQDSLWEYEKGYSIIGMTGFAQYNEEFNANNCYIAQDIDRNTEIKLSSLCEQRYLAVLRKCIANDDQLLIVCSHYPVKDWIAPNNLDKRCIYLAGHDHKNKVINENGCTIYEDNQVGYKNDHICFKRLEYGEHFNPFADLPDGIHKINTYDYTRFLVHKNISVRGLKNIKNHINKYDKNFYLIKCGEYYLFLLHNDNTTCIVYKGQITKTKHNTLDYFYKNFCKTVEELISVYKPFRMAQNMLRDSLKQIYPDSGKIHGCIIDVDRCNHIMLNPNDGKITFYYSPQFGYVQEYKCLQDLMKVVESEDKWCPMVVSENKENVLSFWHEQNHPLMIVNLDAQEKMVCIDIKNSVYSLSREMQKLQYLYEHNVLGFWYDTSDKDIDNLYKVKEGK